MVFEQWQFSLSSLTATQLFLGFLNEIFRTSGPGGDGRYSCGVLYEGSSYSGSILGAPDVVPLVRSFDHGSYRGEWSHKGTRSRCKVLFFGVWSLKKSGVLMQSPRSRALLIPGAPNSSKWVRVIFLGPKVGILDILESPRYKRARGPSLSSQDPKPQISRLTTRSLKPDPHVRHYQKQQETLENYSEGPCTPI